MKNKYVQVYNVWVLGRLLGDVDQQLPIKTNIDSMGNWHKDFHKAYADFINADVKNESAENVFNDEIFRDYIVTLFVIDIDVERFEEEYGIKFDLSSDEVQESIPYYDDYKFTTVSERVSEFSNMQQDFTESGEIY